MRKPQQITKLKEFFIKEKHDLIDWEAFVDSELTLDENLNFLSSHYKDLLIPEDAGFEDIISDFEKHAAKSDIKSDDGRPMGLRRLVTKVRVHDIYSFDIETYKDKNDFLMGGVWGDNVKRTFWNKEEMINYLITKPRFRGQAFIFATNLGFDILALFSGTDHFKKMFFVQRGGQIIRVDYKTDDGEVVTFLDSMNYVAFSVKKMGNVVGIPKLEFDDVGDYDKMLNNRDELIAYNLRDCEITYNFMKLLQSGFNELGCDLKTTIASTALNLFQRKYLENDLYVSEPDIREFVLKAYYGGRTEAFIRGTIDADDFSADNLNYYDVNSLYPYAMNNFIYPNTNYSRVCNPGSMNLIKRYEGVSNVVIECPDIDYPFLPFRTKEKLLFPKGILKGNYTHIELRKALEIGYKILEIKQTVYYTVTHKPFKDYVTALYNKRLEYKKNESPLELVAKLLLNSLYGKFAQKTTQEEIFYLDSLTPEEFIAKSLKYEVCPVDKWLYVKVDDRIPNFSLPVYSAYITGYARIVLYDYMKKAGTVIYTDTDSIITPSIMKTSNKLGDLKLEHSLKRIIIIKPKMYYLGNGNDPVIKIKGVRRIKGFYNFMKVIEGEPITQMKFTKMKESIRRGFSFNQKIFVSKKLDLEDTKRKWDKKFNVSEMQISEAIKI